ncbi:MAG: dihydrolipoyl dehydrogenase [Candidatus Omnitrophica bacterium]|nr:dihydrolipoyl dehydrogenase [Candidatus Omnitrophota bacterium]
MSQSFLLTIIGAGPGGVSAALEASRLGLRTALVEQSRLGGTCLWEGCIPSKTFLHAASVLNELGTAKSFGIETGNASLNPALLLQKKKAVMAALEKGVRASLEKAKVTVISGSARFTGPNRISVGEESIQSQYVILATGSKPRALPQFPFDGKQIISSTEGLETQEIPRSLLIIGGGVIGVEFASMYSSFGTKVILVELLDRLIATEDAEISKRLEISLKKKGVEIYLNDSISEKKWVGDAFQVQLKSGANLAVSKILVAVGRSRNTENLNLEAAGVRLTKSSAVEVDEYLETSEKGIFAVGDIIEGPQLAHAASYEGMIAARNVKDKRCTINLSLVPSAIYTHPEVASVGQTLEQARQNGISEALEIKMLFGAVGRSHTEGVPEGIAKLVYEKTSGRILGAHLFGPHVTELISEMTLAIHSRLTLRDLAQIIHPHPTLAEIFQELARTTV